MNHIAPGMESKESIDALFLYATEGILVVNERGTITRANPSVERLFGYKTGELSGKLVETLVPKRAAGHHMDLRNKFNANPHARAMGKGYDLHGVRKDGSEFPVEISLSPYATEEGKFVIAFIIDITPRKEAEEKLKNYSAELEKQVTNRTLILQEAIDQLEKTKKELHDALQKEKDLGELKSRFVSMASHEFRTPLTTMLSSVSLVDRYAQQGDLTSQSKHISKIKNSIHHLTDILDDFLSLGKLEEGRIENNPEQFNIRDFITEIVSEMKPLAKPKQEIEYRHTGNELVSLDPKILKHILFNLVSNALKFSPDDGKAEVVSTAGDTIVITVQDHGIGIPKADQPHLFERFFRGHNATNIQGTGLGLHIVTRYVELMDAAITFESEEFKGTKFTLVIPVLKK